jgi:SAM-dependent methyltransferase
MTVACVLLASSLSPGPIGRLLHVERNFFGVIRVTYDSERNAHRLFHGSTLHGQQSLSPALRRRPSTYYTRSGPIGQVFEALASRLLEPGARIAVVGLGVGTLTSYSQRGQHWTFYEIDPAMERIARDARFFTYLEDSPNAVVNVVVGDARLRLADAPNATYRLIVLDAFSSDVIPVHLLSTEAVRLYRGKLAAGGVLAFNLTNRYLDLEPVVGRQAENEGLVCRLRYDLDVSDPEKRAGKQPSIWAVMAVAERDLGSLIVDPRWCSPAPRAGSGAWTDDYSDLASYLILTPSQRWRRERRHWMRVDAALHNQ